MKLDNPLEILVVEDNPINQRLVKTLLKRMGATATCADNGKIALQKLESQSFDAILMDLSMPEMDGLTATKEIRQTQDLSEIPIIALTAHSFANFEAKCMDAGMNAFLTKPVNNSKLFDTLSRICPPPSKPYLS